MAPWSSDVSATLMLMLHLIQPPKPRITHAGVIDNKDEWLIY
jgi:hypothetical protein